MDIAFIDHYDSFSFNVIEWLKAADPTLNILHVAFDDLQKMQDIAVNPRPLVLSPGPRDPEQAVSTTALVQRLWGKAPMLGICLGHQILAFSRGAVIMRHADPHHGLARRMDVTDGTQYEEFSGLGSDFQAGVYHSLTIAKQSLLNTGLVATATDMFGEVQAIRASDRGMPPTIGFQFHPESFLTDKGALLARNWLEMVASYYAAS